MSLVVTASLLESGLVDLETRLPCSIRIDPQTSALDQESFIARRHVDLVAAINCGCQSLLDQASQLIDATAFLGFCKQIGFGRGLGSVPPGRFPQEEKRDLLPLLRGEDLDLRPSPLELLRLAALIGTGGGLPLLHSAEEMRSGKEPVDPQFAKSTWQCLRNAMCSSSAARSISRPNSESALQIGAWHSSTQPYSGLANVVIGFFPASQPCYAFYASQPAVSEADDRFSLVRRHLFAQPWP
jgi:hypothetical protein